VPRPAKVWKRSSDNFWYATIAGKKVKLAADYEEALETFHRLKAEAPKASSGAGASSRLKATLEEACNAFLEEIEASRSPGHLDNCLRYLQSFCDFAGKGRRVADLKEQDADRWCRAEKGWGPSTQAAARRVLKACLNWCARNGVTADNPLRNIAVGTFRRRERILKGPEKARLHEVLRPGRPLTDFILFLEQTGCRPFSEAAQVTAAMVNWEDGSILLEKHKNAKKGKTRKIYLTPALLTRLRQLAERHPEGPLLRRPNGEPWNRQDAGAAFRKLARRAGIGKFHPYALRHTYITDALSRGIPASVVAALVGNSVQMVHRYYDHIDQHTDALKEAARKAVE
jgi:integrase